jgi:membrane-associated phospholipid phosphatase
MTAQGGLNGENNWRRTMLVVLAWTLAGLACLPFDVPLARRMLDGWMPGELRAIFHRAEVFGHFYGALGIVITIYLLDPRRRPQLWHVPACFLAGGLTADLLKLQIWRVRPYAYVDAGMTGSSFVGVLWTMPRERWSEMLDQSHHSFPSAHMAGAVALAYSLSGFYPAGRWWFYLLAILCGMNRIDGGAHFASDVCWGAAVGYLVARLVPPASRLATPCFARRTRAKMAGDVQSWSLRRPRPAA